MTEKRSPLASALLNLFAPPLGFVYVRKPGYAGAYLAIFCTSIAVASWSKVIFLPFGFLSLVAILVALWICSAALAAVFAHRHRSVTPPRWYMYVIFIVAPLLLSEGFRKYRGELFGYEVYSIPSGSMIPTLLIGDNILVDTNFYDRNARRDPMRGDVVVFLTPHDPATSRAKRIVGLPGDQIAYRDKMLYINGEKIAQEVLGTYSGSGAGADMTGASLHREAINERAHEVLIQSKHPAIDVDSVVSEDHYFVLGDNRDNSLDGRYFGAVPRDHLVGKVVLIWMHIEWPKIEGSWPKFKVSRPYVDVSRFAMPVH